jgi:selenide,water dikinase
LKRLLLLGGGHSHVEVLRRFGLWASDEIRVTLVSPDRYTAYSGMLPGFIAGHYGFHDCHIDLERVAGFAGAQFLQTSAINADPVRREIFMANGSMLQYDFVSFDVGSIPPTAGIPGASEIVMAVKPAQDFLLNWRKLTDSIAAPARIAVVGGGAAGVEILLSMQHRLARSAPAATTRFLLITDTDRLLASHAPAARSKFEHVLRARNISIHYNSRVTRVEPGAIITAGGQRIAADTLVWATGAAAPSWLQHSGLAVDAAGFIAINAHLQSTAHPEVFAAGDCATIQGVRFPKSGVYAVRQGPLLAANLQRALTGKPLRTYRPQQRALALISTGDRYAIASYGNYALAGKWIWHWKDRIDRKFIAKYNSLSRAFS